MKISDDIISHNRKGKREKPINGKSVKSRKEFNMRRKGFSAKKGNLLRQVFRSWRT